MIDIDFSEITKDFFEKKCLAENIPCIIRNCHVNNHLQTDKNNNISHCDESSPSLQTDYLKEALIFTEHCCRNDNDSDLSNNVEQFSSLLPPHVVSDEKIKNKIRETEVEVETSFRVYEKMKLKDFFAKCPGLLSNLTKQSSASSPSENPSWYLKDWHFAEFFENTIMRSHHLQQEHDQPGKIFPPLYLLPSFMRDFAQEDALLKFQRWEDVAPTPPSSSSLASPTLPNKFGAGNHEYRFVYAGGKGSATLPHFDVCATYSWSLNLSGTKQWKFFTSNETNEQVLKTYFLGSDATLKQHLMKEQGKFDSMDDLLFASAQVDADPASSQITTLIQNPGDIIFVPSLRLHEVRNVTACVSVNQNWYALPYSIQHILRLISIETQTALRMLGSETVDILKNHSSREDWENVFNLTLQGSYNWSLNVVKKFIVFSLMDEQNKNVETRNETIIESLSQGLDIVIKMEKEIIG